MLVVFQLLGVSPRNPPQGVYLAKYEEGGKDSKNLGREFILWGIGKNIKKEGACLTISYDYWQTKYCWDVMFRPTNCNYIYKHTESEFELKGFFQSTPSPSPPPSPPPSPSPRPKSATNRVSSTRFYGGAQSHIAIWGALGWGGRGCSELPPTSRLCTVCQLPNIFMRLLFIKQRNVDCGRAVKEAVFWCG